MALFQRSVLQNITKKNSSKKNMGFYTRKLQILRFPTTSVINVTTVKKTNDIREFQTFLPQLVCKQILTVRLFSSVVKHRVLEYFLVHKIMDDLPRIRNQ
jgi:hypothetical protein